MASLRWDCHHHLFWLFHFKKNRLKRLDSCNFRRNIAYYTVFKKVIVSSIAFIKQYGRIQIVLELLYPDYRFMRCRIEVTPLKLCVCTI